MVGAISFIDGQGGNIVLVGPRQNPKGATLVLPGESGGPLRTMPLADGLGLLHPQTVVDIVCMQERAFGQTGLPTPFDPPEQP